MDPGNAVGFGRGTPARPSVSTTPGAGPTTPDTTATTALQEEVAALRAQIAALGTHHTPPENTTASTPSMPPGGAVDAVTKAIKLPPYWANDPALWFAQVEAVFATYNIRSQATKFNVVLSSLSMEYATEVRDLLLERPQALEYDVLKATLIKRTQLSDQQRMEQLLNGEHLGDRTPTQLLRRMQQLLGSSSLDRNLLRQLFEQRLPSSVRMVLASLPADHPLDAVAEMADKIMQVTPPAQPATAVHAVAPPVQTHPPGLEPILASLHALTTKIDALVNHPPYRGRSNSRSGSRSRGPSFSAPATSGQSSDQPSDICFYHNRFGEAARRCTTPCAFKPTPSTTAPSSSGN